jgi:ATP-dependent DNA helicase RecG
MSVRLEDPCQFLKGVGPYRAAALARLGVHTVEDLLLHIPRRYFDRSHIVPLRELRPQPEACVRVRIESLHAVHGAGGRRLVHASVADDTGRLDVVWYSAWPREALHPGDEVLLAGTVVERHGRCEMRQPEFERIAGEDTEPLHGGRIVAMYPLTRGISQQWLRTLMDRTLAAVGDIPEVLPAAVCGGGPARAEALRAIHFPADLAAAARARERLQHEELFFVQLLLARRRERAAEERCVPMSRERGLHTAYLAGLPFKLTAAQERVLEEICLDVESGHWMRRLLQGDVGAGKTVVAASALLLAVGNGWQGALMVPTEALALQHAERLAAACASLGVRADVLVGSRAERDKEELRRRMAAGEVDLVVGTHALIQEGVRWARLGLAVVDEQHRFGVLQRGALRQGEQRPHILVMTATPIPRSLALTLFGDLDVSRLDEKPPGRRPVSTHLVPPERRDDMSQFVRREIEAGRQAYVVLPIIEASDKLELRAATEEFDRLQHGPLAGLRLGLLHGRVPAAEQDALLHEFRRGGVQVLVATSIVEVGIDVANATLMIVHHPERFGLSSLHQLRGRVGRGAEDAYCFLLPGTGVADDTLARLREFAATEDGFRIAELDLEQRGPGDFAGTRQHGVPSLRVAELPANFELLLRARAVAQALVVADPQLERPEHAAMRAHLDSRYHAQKWLAEIG